jgi:phospholipid-binding lipoprotein MlaA
LQLVDVRTQLFAVDSMREGAADDYALVRDAWLQRRDYQIAGDELPVDESLPDYLRDDTANPTVPVDALPVLPGD